MADVGPTTIANIALFKLGEDQITNINTDDSVAAIVCRTMYWLARNTTLELHSWKCALVTKTLARLSEEPDHPDYDYQFQLPTDPKCLRVWEKLDSTDEWEVESSVLLTNATTATIQYISELTDCNKWSPLLQEAIATRLASLIAYRITKDTKKKLEMLQEFGEIMVLARGSDALGGRKNYVDDIEDHVTPINEV